MKKYLVLFSQFAKYGLMNSLEYRFEFITWATDSSLWALLFIFATSLIFGQVNAIAGWTQSETLVLVVTHALFLGLMWLFIYPSLTNFSQLIRKGDFDFYLLKPVSARFLTSFQNFQYDQIVRIVLMTLLDFQFIKNLGVPISFGELVGFSILFFLAIFIFYNVFFIIATTNFWLVNVFNLDELFTDILNLAQFPTQIYRGLLGVAFTYILPVAFMATFPVQFLLGRGSLVTIFLGMLLAGISYISSRLFWNYAITRYQSASS